MMRITSREEFDALTADQLRDVIAGCGFLDVVNCDGQLRIGVYRERQGEARDTWVDLDRAEL